ncbi:MAG: hypothetical protein ACTJHC_01290 [Vagococcus sp.]
MENATRIRQELAKALHAHIVLLKDIDHVDTDSQEAVYFVIRSLGFMLERIPEALVSDDEEDLYFAAFQYYNLLAELKSNLLLSYPQVTMTGLDMSQFPDTYVNELNTWWENKTGLKADEPTKQTMSLDKK